MGRRQEPIMRQASRWKKRPRTTRSLGAGEPPSASKISRRATKSPWVRAGRPQRRIEDTQERKREEKEEPHRTRGGNKEGRGRGRHEARRRKKRASQVWRRGTRERYP